MAEKLSAVFSAISLGQISKIKQISYTENGQSLDTKADKNYEPAKKDLDTKNRLFWKWQVQTFLLTSKQYI